MSPTRHRSICLLLCVTVVMALCATTAVSFAEERTFVYTVKAGDTCMGLAIRFYNDKSRWDLIHKYNGKLGPLPHRLKAGTTLILPLLVNDPDARVTGRRGQVQAKPPSNPSWKQASVGLGLYRAWQVNSRQESTAELTFLDTSRLYMRENTLVVIYGNTSQKVRRRTTSAELQYGTLRARMGDLAGGDVVQVSTPSSDAELTGGEALVGVDEDKVTRVANHRGKPAAVYSKKKAKKRKAVVVKAGMGSKVKQGEEPSPPKPLPPAPSWAVAQERAVFVAPGAGSVDVSFAWNKEPKAARYRIELFGDAERTRSLAAVPFPAAGAALPPDDVLRLELKGQPPGSYYITVSSIDNDKFEGPPSQVAGYTAIPLKALGPNNAWLEAFDAVPMGTRLTLPPRFKCQLNDAPATSPVIVTKSGANRLECARDSGAPVILEFETPGTDATLQTIDRSTESLPRQAATRVKVLLSENFHTPLRAIPPAGVTVGTMTKAEPGVWEVVVTIAEDAPQSFALPIALDIDGAPIVGTLDVQVEDEGGSAEEDQFIVLSGGAFVDYGFFYAASAEGNLASDRSLVRPGLRLTLLLDDLLLIEAEGAPVFDVPTGDATSATRLGYRVHGGVLLGSGAFRPLILLGHGADLPLEGDDKGSQPMNYLGLGARWAASPDSGMRFELRHGLINQNSVEFAQQTSALVGFYLVF